MWSFLLLYLLFARLTSSIFQGVAQATTSTNASWRNETQDELRVRRQGVIAQRRWGTVYIRGGHIYGMASSARFAAITTPHVGKGVKLVARTTRPAYHSATTRSREELQ
eukprot:scaffold56465_cov35-Tisochrysis_lutea.AAC.1